MSLESDLAALSSLPPAVLQRLIDPSSPAPPPDPVVGKARAQLATFDPNAGVDASVAAARAYVVEMRAAAEEVQGNVIGEGRDVDGETLERIRAGAEEVRSALEEYAEKNMPQETLPSLVHCALDSGRRNVRDARTVNSSATTRIDLSYIMLKNG